MMMIKNNRVKEHKETKKNNGKLSLFPLKFEEAVKDIIKVKPQEKYLPSNSLEQQQEKVGEN